MGRKKKKAVEVSNTVWISIFGFGFQYAFWALDLPQDLCAVNLKQATTNRYNGPPDDRFQFVAVAVDVSRTVAVSLSIYLAVTVTVFGSVSSALWREICTHQHI